MSYWTSTCSDEQAANFADTLQKALSSIIEHADSTPSQLDLFSERNYVQVQKLNANAPQRVEQCAHDLIARHAKTQPQAPAVCAWDGDFTYVELDCLVSQWAAHLIHLGAGPETFIPIHSERSKW
jgi:Non-ribosomal peptide synthetase modules and related proteins